MTKISTQMVCALFEVDNTCMSLARITSTMYQSFVRDSFLISISVQYIISYQWLESNRLISLSFALLHYVSAKWHSMLEEPSTTAAIVILTNSKKAGTLGLESKCADIEVKCHIYALIREMCLIVSA